MRTFKNTPEDRNFLYDLIASGQTPKATFSLGYFASDLANSLTTMNYTGYVTKIDMKSGYCNWKNMNGKEMSCVNIDCISIL